MKNSSKTKEQLGKELKYCQQKINLLEKKVNKQTASLESMKKIPQKENNDIRSAEAELRESEKRFKTLFEFAPDAYYLIDLRGNIIDGNRAAEKLVGYKKNEVIRKNILRFGMLSPNQVTKAIPLLARNAWGKGTGPDEFTLITKLGEKKTVEILTHPVKIKNRIVVLGIARDITQRKEAEKNLSESQAKLRNLFDSVTEGIFALDLNGIYTQVNKRLALMHGLKSVDDMIGKNSFNFVAPRDLDKAQRSMKQIFKKDYIARQEYTALRNDGTEFIIEISATLMRDNKGKPSGFIGSASDITDRKKADEALQQSEEKYRSLVENINDVIFNTNEKGEITFISDKIKDITGFSPDEIINHPFIEFIYPDDRENIIKRFSELKTGLLKPSEYRLLAKHGKATWVRCSSKSQLSGKQFLGITGVLTDINEKKKAEKIIEENTARLNKAQQIAKMGFLDWNLNKNEITFSDQIYQLFGINKNDENSPENTMRFIHPDDFENVQHSLNLAIQGKKQHNMDHRILRPDGKVLWVHAQAELIKDKKGNPERLIGTLFDITKRKQAEEDLKQAEEQYRDLIENAGIAILIDDKDGNLKFFNNKFARIFGYTEEELKAKSTNKLVHPNDLKMVTSYHNRRIAGESAPSRYEFKGISKQGRTIYLEVDTIPIKENGRIVGTRSYLWDISQRKLAEMAELREKQKARQYLDIARVIIVALNKKGEVTLINQKGCQILGYKEEEILGKNWFTNFIPERLRKEIVPIAKKMLLGEVKDKEYYENPILTKSGKEKLIAWHDTLLKDEDGFIIGTLSSGEDITEKKLETKIQNVLFNISQATNSTNNLEELLITVHRELGSLMDTTNFYVALYDDESDSYSFPFCVDEVEKVESFSPQQLKKSLTDYVQKTGKPLLADEKKDKELIKKGKVDLVGEPAKIWMGVPLKTPQGTIGVVVLQSYKDSEVYSKKDLKILSIISEFIALAINKKMAEDELRQSEEQWRSLTETSPDHILLLNTDLRIQFANFASPGLSVKELIGTPLYSYVEEARQKEIKSILERVLNTGFLANYETTYRKPDGSLIFYESRVTPRFNPETKKIIGLTVSSRDITERKESEKIASATHKIAKAINETTNIDRLYPEIHNILWEFIDATNFFIALYDSQKDIIRFSYFTDEQDDDPIIKNASKSGSLTAKVINTGKPLVIKENQLIKKYKKSKKEWGTEPKIWIGIPLKLGKKIIGVIAVQSYTDPNLYSVHDVEILESISGAIAFAIQRKTSFDEIVKRQKYLESVMHSTPDAMITLDSNHHVVDWNPGAEWMFGYTRKEAIGKSLDSLVARHDVINEAKNNTRKALSGKKVLPREAVRYRKDGSPVNVILAGSPIKIGNQVVGVVAVYTDITERKKMEDKLKYRQEFENLIASISSDFINLPHDRIDIGINLALKRIGEFTKVDRSYVFQFKDNNTRMDNTHEWCAREISPQKDHLQNMPIDEFYGARLMRDKKIYHVPILASLPPEAKNDYEELKREGIKSLICLPLIYKKNVLGFFGLDSVREEKIWSNEIISLLRIVGETIANTLEHKWFVEALFDSESKYSAVVENSKDGIVIIQDGKLSFANSAAALLLGYSPKSMIGTDFIQFIIPAAREMAAKRYQDRLAGKKVPNIYELPLLKKDGTELAVEISATLIKIENKKSNLIFVRDITNRKKTEEAIKESEKKYREVVEQASDLILTTDIKGNWHFSNEALMIASGYSQAEIEKMNYLDLVVPEYKNRVKFHFFKQFLKREPTSYIEFPWMAKSGKVIWFAAKTNLIYENDEVIGFHAISRDITEQKKAEEALRESETRFRSLYENSVLGLYRTTPQGKILMANPTLVRMLGYSSFEELSKRNLEKEGYEPEYPKTEFKEQMEKNGEVIGLKTVWRKKDGTKLHLSESTTAVFDQSGKVIYYDGTVEDISKRMEAENALKDSEERFRLAANISTDLIYEWDVSSDELKWYGGLDNAVGYPENTIPRTIAGWTNLIHPEDQLKLKDAVIKHRTSTNPIYEEYRIQHKDGTWRYWIDKGTPVLNDQTLPVKWIGSCVDITEAKKAEQALQESEQNYRNLIETSNDGIYLLYDRKFEIVNKKFQQMMKISQEELNKPNFDVMDLVAPKSRPLVEERIKKSASGEKQEPTYEFTALAKDKKEIEIETTVSYVKYKKSVATLGIFRDISERKRMENLIERIIHLKENLLEPLILNEKLKLITDGIVDIFDGDFARIWMITPGDHCDSGCFHAQQTKGPHVCRFRNKCLHLMVSSGRYSHTDGKIHQRVPFGCYKIGRIASGKDNRFLTNDVQNDKRVHDHSWARKFSLVSFAGYRLISGNEEPIGVLAFFSKNKISPAIDDLIRGIANTTSQVIQNSIAEESLRISEQRFASIFNSAGDGIMYLNKKGNVLEVNPSLLRLTGFSRDEFIGKNALTLARKFVKPKDIAPLLLKMKDALKGLSIMPYELEYRNKIFEVSAPILKGSPGITGIIHDITEKKQTFKKIQQSLEEKDVLLQEIHHRVKNNLMIIIGLLNYYSLNVEDEQINKIFYNLQNTIHSMALIHEKLYQQEDIAKINFVYYVKDLANHLLGIHIQYMGQVTFRIKIDDILLNLRTAIPCGMIINELVSNALKHAFPEIQINRKANGKRKKPQKFTIQIEINKGKMLKSGKISSTQKGWYHLKVCDNGIGLPKDINPKESNTLGLRLVNLMVEQLEGHIKMGIHKGSCFKINFKEQ